MSMGRNAERRIGMLAAFLPRLGSTATLLPSTNKFAVRAVNRPFLPAALAGATLLGLAACGRSYSPNTYAAAAAQQANVVDRGVIVGVRQVVISANGTVGAVAGGAAGGVTGAQAPGGTFASALGAIGGTLLGGLAGTAAEQATSDVKAYEYIVQETDGKLLSVTQTDRKPLAIGTHVLVITGKQARVVQDYTVKLPGAPQDAVAQREAPPAAVKVSPLSPPLGAAAPPAGTAEGPSAPSTAAPPPQAPLSSPDRTPGTP
jgi:outer membrane lipoprotein SlyB